MQHDDQRVHVVTVALPVGLKAPHPLVLRLHKHALGTHTVQVDEAVDP